MATSLCKDIATQLAYMQLCINQARITCEESQDTMALSASTVTTVALPVLFLPNSCSQLVPERDSPITKAETDLLEFPLNFRVP